MVDDCIGAQSGGEQVPLLFSPNKLSQHIGVPDSLHEEKNTSGGHVISYPSGHAGFPLEQNAPDVVPDDELDELPELLLEAHSKEPQFITQPLVITGFT